MIFLLIIIIVVIFIYILRLQLHKSQQLWNIVLFKKEKNESLFEFLDNNYSKQFTPRCKIRTNYHYITGYADPFLFSYKGWLYLFYEEEHLNSPAWICGVRTKDLKHWEKIGVVLKEPFHLSFPFVFENEGQIYMLPETRQKDAVILYKSTGFPYNWESIQLLSGDKFVDSSVIKHENMWYLFTTVWYGENNGLKIFVSEQLEGGWQEHPRSPITEDITFSRCGGAVLSVKGKLFRPAQDCSAYYGENVVLYEITELTPTSYKEERIKGLIENNNSWSIHGGHHFSTTEFKGQNIVAMDGIVDDNIVNNHTRKLFNYCHNKCAR